MKFVTAVKIYHQRNGSKYKVPRKGTPEYDSVRKIMLEGGPAPAKTKTKNINMDVKPAIVNKVVSEILEDIEMSKASEMVKDILSKHMKEAEREVTDTFQGEGINDLLKMIPESIASQKDINQVKQSAVDVSKGKFDADELFASFKNIKKAVNKIDNTIKKEVKKQQGSGLSQLGGGFLEDLAKLINPILPILKSVSPMPLKVATDSIENLKRDFDIVKKAINKVGLSAKKQQGSGLMQLGNGDQSGGFIFTIPLIISGLVAGAQALAAGAAGAVGARLAKGVINLTEGKKF
tara:strand:+ start:1 stop:876 length:876 start_codon:yes stop_codon:yes gene_type:complete